MVLVKDTGSEYEIPAAGRYNAVCVDMHDRGMVKKTFGGVTEERPEVRVVFALGTPQGEFLRNSKGWIFTVQQDYRASLNERAALRKMIEQWINKHLTKEQVNAGLDLERLVGRPGEVKVKVSDDGKWANIDWVEPLQPGWVALPIPPAGDNGYTRIKDRKKDDPAGRPGDHRGPGMDRDIPPPEDPFGPAPAAAQGSGHGYPAGPPKLDDDPF